MAASATTESASSTATGATTETSSGRSFRQRSGFVDNQLSALEILTIECLNGFIGFVIVCHFDKPETAGSAGHLIDNDISRSDLASRSKELLQTVIGRVVGQIAYI